MTVSIFRIIRISQPGGVGSCIQCVYNYSVFTQPSSVCEYTCLFKIIVLFLILELIILYNLEIITLKPELTCKSNVKEGNTPRWVKRLPLSPVPCNCRPTSPVTLLDAATQTPSLTDRQVAEAALWSETRSGVRNSKTRLKNLLWKCLVSVCYPLETSRCSMVQCVWSIASLERSFLVLVPVDVDWSPFLINIRRRWTTGKRKALSTTAENWHCVFN